MAQENVNSITGLDTKFKNAALELDDVDEVVFHQSENDEKKGVTGEEICLIGKIIKEGEMGIKTVERFIGFTWNFIPAKDLKVFEVDTNIMQFKFKDWDTLNKVFDTRPWRIKR